MLKIFPIDFIRQAFEQTLLKEHNDNQEFFGGKDQVNISSFYEQLKNQDEVDRFVETYRDLADQQNRSGLILNGVIVAPENPTITNLYSSLIIPMSFTCSMRCLVGNRDRAIWTINNLIDNLKGSKVDIAQLNCIDEEGKKYSVPFMVDTIGHNDNEPTLKNGDYIGTLTNANAANDRITEYTQKGVTFDNTKDYWFYCQHNNKLKVIYYDHNNNAYSFMEDDGNHNDIIFPPEHDSFEKYKVSFSFDAIRCDEPRNLNAEEYCELSFGGNATLVNASVQLGNDLLKIYMSKLGFQGETWVSFEQDGAFPGDFLEPLEMPSGNNANTQISQLVSNNFKSNSHTDAIALTLQYTFVYDKSISLLKQLFDYSRYGKQPDGEETPFRDGITPNIIYGVYEIWSSWGDLEIIPIRAKIVENIDVENTESDTLTLSVTMQIQGENASGNGGLQ